MPFLNFHLAPVSEPSGNVLEVPEPDLLGFQFMRTGWLVERWAPLRSHTREFTSMGLGYHAKLATEHGLSPTHCEALNVAAADPDRSFDNPDFCFREYFVVTLGRLSA
jgi:arsenite methyltransferase